MIWNTRKKKVFRIEQQERKKNLKNEDKLRNLWNIFKCTNISIIGVPEIEEEEIGNLFEKIMKENFPNMDKEIDMQVQEAQRTLNKMNPKRIAPKHMIIKMPKIKDKDRILKAAREKQIVTYKGVPIRLAADFSKETLQTRRDWQEVFQEIKSKDLQPRLLQPAKLSLRIKGQIKCFPDKIKLKEFIITKPLLHEMLKVLI